MLSGTNANFKVVVAGTKGMFGPVELKESLTNGNYSFEKECIDLFYIEDDDIGDPISMTITLESKSSIPHLFSGAKSDRIMLVENGEYNSLWQIVGDLKFKELKTISLPIHPRQSMKDSTQSPIIPVEHLHLKSANDITPLNTIDRIHSPTIKSEEKLETKPRINNIQNFLSGDYDQDNARMIAIEDHQKRHTFAPSLQQAQQNYRELRRLLKKMNGPIPKEQKIRVTRK